MTRIIRWKLVCLLALVLAAGCDSAFENDGPGDSGPADVSLFTGNGVGAACGDLDGDCRDGLKCVAAKCAPAGDRTEDRKCLLDDECAAGLTCSWSGFCLPAGAGVDGDACTSSSDCVRGLSCLATGFAGFCTPHVSAGGDLGATCADTPHCLPGLACSAVSHTCVPGSIVLNPDIFPGIDCPSEAALPFGVRMALPPEGAAAHGFYDFPFPTDVRRLSGKVDLHDHPRPGPGVLGFDPLDAILKALEADATGFSVNPAVFFRFTRAVDPATLAPTAAARPIRFIDLDAGTDVPFTVAFRADRNKYACGNQLLVHPSWAHALKPGRTYAVLVTTDVRAASAGATVPGNAPAQLDDLAWLVSAMAPQDPAARPAWNTYAKLRAWLTTQGISASRIAGATVFTTLDTTSLISRFHDAANAADAPTVVPGTVVVCGSGQADSCATANWATTPGGQKGLPDPRACPASAPAGHQEIHARIWMPYYQAGKRPYQFADGALVLQKGDPKVIGYEDVCASFEVPAGSPPVGGWPLVIYAHGTGGSYRDGVNSWGDALAQRGIAMMGIDQPMHGPRQGSSRDPGPLFYNFANPAAARGNLYQGAADNFALVRFAKGFQTGGAIGPVSGIVFDPARMSYLGHSQGATTGPLFLPYEPGVSGAVYTGGGGSLVYGLLGKKKPYDASVGLRVGLQELEVTDLHPALHLIQWYFDETDPMVHAPGASREPVGAPRSVLDVVGWDDRYSPIKAAVIFAAALGGGWATPDFRPAGQELDGLEPAADLGLATVTLPVSGNVGGTATGVASAHASDGSYDGHFVATRNPDAVRRVLGFLDSLAHAEVPVVPQ